MTVQHRDYAQKAREANRKVWDGINDLVELQRQWTALDYTNTLVDDEHGLTAAEYLAVIFTTAGLLVDVLEAGSKTNMAKLL